MSEKRFALLMGNTEFPETDGKLPPLPSSRNDVIALQDILSDEQIGWFTDIIPLIDLPHHKLMLSVNKIFREATRDDEILIYYSGHGQLDTHGFLHFSTIDTDLDLLHATSLPASALRAMLRETRCRRIIMLLDCCYSASIAPSNDLFVSPVNSGVEHLKTSLTDGYAVSIIAASSTINQAYDCDKKKLGRLTNCLIEGIKSNEADSNDDGLITMDELFSYVESNMPADQKPVWFNSGPIDSLIISRSQTGKINSRLISQIKQKLTQSFNNGLLGDFVYEHAVKILESKPDEIEKNHEPNLRLLISWFGDKLSLQDFVEQWYEFNETGLPESDQTSQSTAITDRWEVVRTCRKPAIDLMSPTYLLDGNFQFLDWNPMFDELIAKPLALMRGRHVEDFILKLENKREIIRRSRTVFQQDNYPIVDIEVLKLKTKYGMIHFQKIASQIADNEGGTLAWAVNLNILKAEEDEAMWIDLKNRLEEEVNWSLYAKSYDQMLLNFDGYHQLIKKLVNLLGKEPSKVLDLASGTGNVTMELLHDVTDRTIWALEANEDMLEYMREKTYQLDGEQNKQVHILKGDLLLSLREIDDDSFDGAIMMNALYAMPNRARCLTEIYRVLKPDGVLVYSTSTNETDVQRLFSAIRTNLNKKGTLESMRTIVDSAYDRHTQMLGNIKKDTHEDVINYAKQVGFSVQDSDVEKGAYEGAVTIVKAVKTAIEIKINHSTISQDQKIKVFISYAHKDEKWCKRIQDYLDPLNEIEVWTDQNLKFGDQWRNLISEKLQQTTVAILLISTPFLNSKFIKNNELPALLHLAKLKGVLIVPVILEKSAFEFVTYQYPDPVEGPEEFNLSELQAAGSPTEPMSTLKKSEQNLILHEIATQILALNNKTGE